MNEKEAHLFRQPKKDDGSEVWRLIKDTGVLDLNSSYSYLMWCKFFNDTSIVAESNDGIVGFVSGFIVPATPDKLFIWQVAVSESERGKGLASLMLKKLLNRKACIDIHYLETTITPSNIPSQKLFHRLAKDLSTEIHVSECFNENDFPEKGHEDEHIHLIGPFELISKL